ncbi:MAG: T9SS type A sorting domain-containing protein [Candidatus Marinimicrobia bacterium]|nr:T9SS type A sorting domain-containing protein [Candidatus Neomarinimicrobiota bacterium]
MLKKLPVIFSFSLALTLTGIAQEAPQAEPVYGGYIEELQAAPIDANTTRIYAATMSANSMFYADVDHSGTSPSFGGWNTVPDMDWDDNYGELRAFAADAYSGFVFAGLPTGGVIAASPTTGSLYTVDAVMIEAIQTRNGNLFYQVMEGGAQKLYFADIDAAGVVGTIQSLVISTATWNPRFSIQIVISPYDGYVYVFVPDVPPLLYKSSDPYDSFSLSTTFSTVSTSDLASTGYEYSAFLVAPDNHYYAASYEGNSAAYATRISSSDDGGTSWSTSIVTEDAGRGDFRVAGDSSSYNLYYSRIVSDDKGLNWSMHGGADGAIAADPNAQNIAYVRTDWAMGLYDHSIPGIDEINTGLLAVQVNDFAMDTSKSTAWVASKSGIWYVTDYGTASVTWTDPIWPDYDSTPYDVVTCTATADTAYMGNSSANVFRYETAHGDVNDPMNYDRIFEAQFDAAYTYWNWTYGSRISAIAQDETYAGERLFVGIYDDEDWDEPADSLGAVFVGTASGSSWSWTQITGGDFPATGIDVLDIVVVEESGNTVAYVGVEYNTAYSTVNGVYRCEEVSGSWIVTSDLYLSASYPISATIVDLYVSQNDTIYACGTDASGTTVRAYKKAVGDTYWESLTSSGLVYPNAARAITYDEVNMDLYMAIDNTIYVLYYGATSWAAYYDYPVGTDIRFIYYDDLLVGTGVGLFGHAAATSIDPILEIRPLAYQLEQNYPNPFNPSTVISYQIPQRSLVELRIYDLKGRQVSSLVKRTQAAGAYKVTFDGSQLSSGLYLYSLTAGDVKITRKLMLMK